MELRNIRARRTPSLGLFVVGGFLLRLLGVLCALVVSSWSSESLGFGGSGRVVGARSRWGVQAWHEGRGREAPLCQLCHASLCVRVESAGESSPAPWKAELSRCCPSCHGGQTSRLAHHRTTRVQVTCNGLVGPVRSSRLHAIKVYGPCLAPSSLRVAFFFAFE